MGEPGGTSDRAAAVALVPTNEELAIAREAASVLAAQTA
jgi:acetate kinase